MLEARAATVDAEANAVAADRNALRQAWTSIAPSEPWPACRFETSAIEAHEQTSAALLARPAVQAFESQATAAFRREGAASAQLIPEPTLSVGYIYRPDPAGVDGVDFVTAQLSVPLPFLFGAPFAAEDVARADAARARAKRNAFLRHNRGQLRALDARRRLQASRVHELETIASPLAKAASEVAQAAYSSGDGSVAPVLEAERTRLDIEKAVVDSRAQLARIELERLRMLGAFSASPDAPTP